MASANYDSVAGFATGRHRWYSIGNTTVEGTTYNNVVLRYTTDTRQWAVLSYVNRPMAFARYINGTAVTIAYGDTTARVYTLDSGLTDNGTVITYELMTHDLEFGSRGVLKKVYDKLMVYTESAPEAIVQIRVDRGDWITLGTVKETVEQLSINEVLFGHIFQLRVVGASSTVAMRLKGFEFPSVELLSYGVK